LRLFIKIFGRIANYWARHLTLWRLTFEALISWVVLNTGGDGAQHCWWWPIATQRRKYDMQLNRFFHELASKVENSFSETSPNQSNQSGQTRPTQQQQQQTLYPQRKPPLIQSKR
jgi:hypothetical protein